jgi:hypothetical protein
MELDASMLRPIVGHALDAAVVVPVEWSVVPIVAGMARDWVCFVSQARRALVVCRAHGR